mmetsp:Transcript_43135/g.125604  ORF Transcript_43135/g.125604 Transcript_43135/m.125604 type:complete len:206 (+) Transcript_43135:1152-1769(+)
MAAASPSSWPEASIRRTWASEAVTSHVCACLVSMAFAAGKPPGRLPKTSRSRSLSRGRRTSTPCSISMLARLAQAWETATPPSRTTSCAKRLDSAGVRIGVSSQVSVPSDKAMHVSVTHHECLKCCGLAQFDISVSTRPMCFIRVVTRSRKTSALGEAEASWLRCLCWLTHRQHIHTYVELGERLASRQYWLSASATSPMADSET